MRILSYMIVKDEATRYLDRVIPSLLEQVDDLVVFDDNSTDDTPELLSDYGISHYRNGGSTFMDGESSVREQAWHLMERLFEAKYGDWILTLDADEILRTSIPLKDICRNAVKASQEGVWMHIHEMWSPTEIRTDGFWGTIKGLRLCAYKPNGKFVLKKMGGGSLPDYIGHTGETDRADIVHYGYAKQVDREQKFERYFHSTGHNARHINSILEAPVLDQLPQLL